MRERGSGILGFGSLRCIGTGFRVWRGLGPRPSVERRLKLRQFAWSAQGLRLGESTPMGFIM